MSATFEIPAMVSAHSHAFQVDLRGVGERNDSDFWGWREAMYALADRLDPDGMYEVALRTCSSPPSGRPRMCSACWSG